jgi:hypothetical protein
MRTVVRKLEGKVAVITAATSGMALATAKLFVEEGASSKRSAKFRPPWSVPQSPQWIALHPSERFSNSLTRHILYTLRRNQLNRLKS